MDPSPTAPPPLRNPPTPVPAVGVRIYRVRTRDIPRAVWRVATDRRRLAGSPGLTFAKLVGTGDGETFDLRDADVHTWGIVGAWTTPAARAAFDRGPVASAWSELAVERWEVDMLPVRSAGRWSGATPFTPTASGGPTDRPVAALTRARLRARRAVEFWRAVPPVTTELRTAPGLLCSLGIGEAPIGLQGTFSVWRDAGALRAFAYGRPHHRDAVRATHDRGWYAEDLFARFVITAARGTLAGRDPLAGAVAPPDTAVSMKRMSETEPNTGASRS